MSIIHKLATSLNRRDEVPNQELAKEIVDSNDAAAVVELVENLSNKNKDIQNDCIKVLYEIGEKNPVLIADYAPNFIALLDSKNNRLQWGAMAAINAITTLRPAEVFGALGKLTAVADKGSVITRDGLVSILTKLCAIDTYKPDAFNLLNEQLLSCPSNQLPMYAENALPIINEDNKAVFISTLTGRLVDFEKETKRNRVEKVLKKVQPKK